MTAPRQAKPGIGLVHPVATGGLALTEDIADELVGDRCRGEFGCSLLNLTGFYDQVPARVDVVRAGRAALGAIGIAGIGAVGIGDTLDPATAAVDVKRERVVGQRTAQECDRG